jgi:DNA polymerase III epsilon subunit family exonuclease
MFESDLEDNIFRRRLMKEVVAGLPVHFSFYSPRVKVQVQDNAEHLLGANGRYIGDGVTIEFVPQGAAAVERVREFVWCWEEHNEFTAVRKINHLRRGADPESVQGLLERVRGVDKRAAAKAAEAVEPDKLREMIEAEDAKTLARLPGLGEKRAHAVVEFYRNERSPRRFLYAANRNDRFRGAPVFTELDLEGDLEEQVFAHAARARSLGDPDPLGANEPPGHTTVRNANMSRPLPTTPSLMGRASIIRSRSSSLPTSYGACSSKVRSWPGRHPADTARQALPRPQAAGVGTKDAGARLGERPSRLGVHVRELSRYTRPYGGPGSHHRRGGEDCGGEERARGRDRGGGPCSLASTASSRAANPWRPRTSPGSSSPHYITATPAPVSRTWSRTILALSGTSQAPFAPPMRASLPLDEAPFVVFDVETTGSSAKEGAITEIGALKVAGGRVVDEFATLVNPGRPIQPFVVRLTGITDRMVADAPFAADVMPLFEEFTEGCVLVGHNVHFDCSFVSAAREASGLASLPNPVLDTLKLTRVLVPGLKRYRLSSLVSHFGVRAAPNHRALADAAATAEVFLSC